MDDAMVLARWRQYARHLNMFSWAHPSPQPKRILISSAIFAQLTAVSSGMAGHVLSPKNYTFTQGQSGPLSNMWFLCQPESKSQTTSHSVQPFCTAHGRDLWYFTMGRRFLQLKLSIPIGDLDPNLIHGSLGPPESSTHTASQSVEPFLQGSLVQQTDRQTDRPRYSVDNNKPHLCTWYCDAA